VHNPEDRSFIGHPRGLGYIAFTEAWERFSYYGMQALLVLYMVNRLLHPGHIERIAGFGPFRHLIESFHGPLSVQALASTIFGLYTHSIKYFTVLAFAVAVTAIAQSPLAFPESPQLFETVAQLDAKMFGAFNVHDVDLLMSMFTDDMEFYHDKGGLTNREQTREGFAKMFGNSPDIRRELIPGSLQVYPIKDFGAIEIGTHRFCHKENGKDDCGNFPFVMVWRKSADSWKVSRVISYGH